MPESRLTILKFLLLALLYLFFIRVLRAVSAELRGPVPADYNGDGTDEVAVYRQITGSRHLQSGLTSFNWGVSGDIPVPADYDNNGTEDIAVFRPSSGVWFIRNGPTAAWGTNGDDPLPLSAAVREAYFP